MRIVKVSLNDRSYAIQIGAGLLPRLGRECARLGLGRRCAIITDENVAPRFGRRALQSLEGAGFVPGLITVPAGIAEPVKTARTAAKTVVHAFIAGRLSWEKKKGTFWFFQK
ncbi:MAG TPA: hypothetical protein P5233_14380 [Candidatus Paceibacterota bacterium]|nr:hypothetical protein [Candidatus Paceibacterota bacterium]